MLTMNKTLQALAWASVLIGTVCLPGCNVTPEYCQGFPTSELCKKYTWCEMVYIKDTSRSYEICHYWDGQLTSEQAPEGFGNIIQPIGVQSSSTRGGASASSEASGPLKPSVQTSTPYTTTFYVLDVLDLVQIDPLAGTLLHSLDLTAGQPGTPARFAVTSDNRSAIVTNINKGNQPYVLIVDLAKFAVTSKIVLPQAGNAYGIALTPDNKFAYIITQSLTTAANSVVVLNLSSSQVV